MAPQGRQKTGDKKELIFNKAQELFSQKGFKETNVPEITAAAGIAAGTFYLYYSSKEELFMEIFNQENTRLKQEIMDSIDLESEPAILIKQIIQKNQAGLAENPILKEWYNKESFARIEEKFRETNGLEKVNFMYDLFQQIVEKWQAEGKFRSDMDSGMIMALFGAVIIADMHKEEIGYQYFPKVQDYLMEFVLQGLRPAGKTGL